MSWNSGGVWQSQNWPAMYNANSPLPVQTFEVLRGIEAPDIHLVMITGSYDDPLPGTIAGFYIRDDNDTTTADNGGTVIVTPNGKRWKRMFDAPIVYSGWFGVDPTGAVNCTTQLKAFFDFCIATGYSGHISAGHYLITTGVLVFDTPFVDAVWPNITTDGFEAVWFDVDPATATDEPILTISNGTANSGAGKYWFGGCLGGITLSDDTGDTAPNRHGLSLRGIWGAKFEYIRGEDLRGSCLFCPEVLYAGTNPDPYAITVCTFTIEANRCARYGVENLNWVGLNGCTFEFLRVVECTLGGFYGFGAGNKVCVSSMGGFAGWAYDDGTHTANTGGSPSRFIVEIAELDTIGNGFRINKTSIFIGSAIRIVHRYVSALGIYWPVKAFEVNGGAAPGNNTLELLVHHRIEAGGVKANMGKFIDFNSIAVTNVTVDQKILDNAGFGFADIELYTNLNNNSIVNLTRDGVQIAGRRNNSMVLARGDGTTVIASAGYGTAAAKLLFPSEESDLGGNYAASEYTAPFSGTYRYNCRFTFDPGAAGIRIRFGIGRTRAAVLGLIAHKTLFSAAAGSQTFDIAGIIDLLVGDILYPLADQNTGAPITCTPIFSQSNENNFQIVSIA